MPKSSASTTAGTTMARPVQSWIMRPVRGSAMLAAIATRADSATPGSRRRASRRAPATRMDLVLAAEEAWFAMGLELVSGGSRTRKASGPRRQALR